MRRTIFLNIKTKSGVETVDEFTQEEGQTYFDFVKYVKSMIKECRIAGINVYSSSRPTNSWKNK